MRSPVVFDNILDKYRSIWEACNNSIDTLYWYLRKYNPEIDSFGNIYVNRGPNLVAAHLDTVHSKRPKPVIIDDDILLSMNGHGIGGDDKCGIVACLELMEVTNCSAIFFDQEETGGKGAQAADYSFFDDKNYMIEIDRRGSIDAIMNSGAKELCSEDFLKDMESYGFERARGSFTDCNIIQGKTNINTINLSAGYYNAHTQNEYVKLSELEDNIYKISCFIENSEFSKKRVEFIPTIKYNFNNNNNKKNYNYNFKDYKDYVDQVGITRMCDSCREEKDWSEVDYNQSLNMYLCHDCTLILK